MRRWFRVIFVALLLAAVVPAYAIPAEFTAWLYTPDTGEMSLIDLSGQRAQPARRDPADDVIVSNPRKMFICARSADDLSNG